MAFSQRLSFAAELVETRLAAMLDAEATNAPPRLVAAMRHGTLGGGKRLRPFLVLESAALFGVPPESAIHAAAAVECVHCYSLIHDDLPAMDNDSLRRGQPTVHKAFDEWTAILAGDALLTLAFQELACATSASETGVGLALIVGLAEASGARGMAGGQCLDLEAEKLKQPPVPSRAHVERLQGMKTGALLRFSCEAGAILGKAGAPERRALAAYGDCLGLSFQIADDLLDLEGDATALGKAVGKDAAKATLHGISDTATARARLAELEAGAISALAPFGARADILRDAAGFVIRRER